MQRFATLSLMIAWSCFRLPRRNTLQSRGHERFGTLFVGAAGVVAGSLLLVVVSVAIGIGLKELEEDVHAHWEMHMDDESGQAYFSNCKTGEVSWTNPMANTDPQGEQAEWTSCILQTVHHELKLFLGQCTPNILGLLRS